MEQDDRGPAVYIIVFEKADEKRVLAVFKAVFKKYPQKIYTKMQEMNENAAVPKLGLVWRWEFTQRRQKKKKT